MNTKLLANQISRQWWGGQVSPSSRNHMWIENGMARYAELLYTENISGAGAMEDQVHDTYVEALTVEQPPLMQSARLEDYSPEFWAATAGKGAAVLHMLRSILGDENFFKLLKTVPERYAGKSINTADFQKMAEEVSGQSLNYFFLQWIESSGAPEFKMEYTMFRVGAKGFRVNGKISQDLDTFRMPVIAAHRHRGQSGGEESRGGGNVHRFRGRDFRQAEECGPRSQGPAAALRQRHARGGGHQARRTVHGGRRVSSKLSMNTRRRWT